MNDTATFEEARSVIEQLSLDLNAGRISERFFTDGVNEVLRAFQRGVRARDLESSSPSAFADRFPSDPSDKVAPENVRGFAERYPAHRHDVQGHAA